MADREINGTLTLPPLDIQGGLAVPGRIDGTLTFPALGVLGEMSVPVGISGTLTLPSLDVQGAVKVYIRTALAAPYRIQRAVAFPGFAAHWAMSARDAAAAWQAPWALTFPRRLEYIINYDGPRVIADVDALWSLRLGQQHIARWSVGSIVQSFGAPWSLRSGSAFAATWACAPRLVRESVASWACAQRIVTDYAATWACAPRLQSQVTAIWGQLAIIRADHVAPWACTQPARGRIAAPWTLSGTTARSEWSALWDASERAALFAEFSARWSIGSQAAATVPEWALTCNGQPLQAFRVSLAQSRADGAWQLSAEIAEPPIAIQPGDDITLTMGARTWALRAASTSAERAESTDKTIDLRATSAIAAWANNPATLPHGGMASTLAAALAGATPITWALPDWRLTPIMAATMAESAPAQALLALAQSAGGMLLSNPDGSLAAMPFSGAHLGAVSALEARLAREASGITGIEVRTHPVSDSIETDGEGNTRTIRVTPQPWRDVSLRLAGGGSTITTPSIETRTITNEVQAIIGGIGATSAPITRIIAATFSDGASRAVHFRANEPGFWLDAKLDTVVTLTYATTTMAATLTTTTRQPVNIIIEDATL